MDFAYQINVKPHPINSMVFAKIRIGWRRFWSNPVNPRTTGDVLLASRLF